MTTTKWNHCQYWALLLFYAVVATNSALAFPFSRVSVMRVHSSRLFYANEHHDPHHGHATTTTTSRVSFYDILGVPRQASHEEIKAAFRRMAKQYHPDVNPHEDSTARFQEINRAYQVLSDEAARQQYNVETPFDKHGSPQTRTTEPRRQWYESSPFKTNTVSDTQTAANHKEEWPYTRYRQQHQKQQKQQQQRQQQHHSQQRQQRQQQHHSQQRQQQQQQTHRTREAKHHSQRRQRYHATSSSTSSGYGSDNPDFGKEELMTESDQACPRDTNAAEKPPAWASPWMWVNASGNDNQTSHEEVPPSPKEEQEKTTRQQESRKRTIDLQQQLATTEFKAAQEESLRKTAEAMVVTLQQQLQDVAHKLANEQELRRTAETMASQLQTQLHQLEEQIDQQRQESVKTRRQLLREQHTKTAAAAAQARKEEQIRVVAEKSVVELQKRIQSLLSKEQGSSDAIGTVTKPIEPPHSAGHDWKSPAASFLSFFSTPTAPKQQQKHNDENSELHHPSSKPKFGLTKSGQPCKRCLKQGSLCWQHQQIYAQQ
mmetsp:Transcript_17752/g.41494  ORF Transcript_17752/g.41494 Transcript_17752/m.41494 type:complete len:543 (-) Transcript_17752:36-1664(-)